MAKYVYNTHLDNLHNREFIMSQKEAAKFIRIQQQLEADIRKGVYPVGSKIPSERELAKALGASHMTVNKALSGLEANGLVTRTHGGGTFVAPEKESIFKRTIGYIGPTTLSMTHAGLPGPLFETIKEFDYITSIFDLTELPKMVESFRLFIKENPCALIIDGRGYFPLEILDEVPPHIKLVFIDNYAFKTRVENASYILGDYFDGGAQAARLLVEQGRKKIVVITHAHNCQSKAGAEHFLSESGVTPYKVVFMDKADDAYWKELASDRQIDGIIASSDYQVVKVIDEMNGIGVKIPDDVAIIGYYDTPWAHAYKLTSVNPQRKSMAEMAMMTITSEPSRMIDIKVKPKITFRKSCVK